MSGLYTCGTEVAYGHSSRTIMLAEVDDPLGIGCPISGDIIVTDSRNICILSQTYDKSVTCAMQVKVKGWSYTMTHDL